MKETIERGKAKEEFTAWLADNLDYPYINGDKIYNEHAAFDEMVDKELNGLSFELDQIHCKYKRPLIFSPSFDVGIENDEPVFYKTNESIEEKKFNNSIIKECKNVLYNEYHTDHNANRQAVIIANLMEQYNDTDLYNVLRVYSSYVECEYKYFRSKEGKK
jgi:hypothetical protein